jgi:ABC-type phosphate transport system ATPase subunit
MDEPTSSLDPAARMQIETLAMELNKSDGLTIIFVTHDMDQARRVGSRTMLLVNGCKIEEADTEEFFTDPKEEISRRFIDGTL